MVVITPELLGVKGCRVAGVVRRDDGIVVKVAFTEAGQKCA